MKIMYVEHEFNLSNLSDRATIWPYKTSNHRGRKETQISTEEQKKE